MLSPKQGNINYVLFPFPEALYSYRGQKQRKVVLTVEQVQGHHYVLVLWGPGAAWYTQLQRKRGKYIRKKAFYLLIPW